MRPSKGAEKATTGVSALALATKVALPLPAKIVAGLLVCLGLLETKDGVQDIKYATMGDPYTETDNFLKNLLGEDAYYTLLEGGTLAMGGYLGAKSVYELASLKLTGNSKWFSTNVVDDVVPPGTVDDLLYSSADDVVESDPYIGTWDMKQGGGLINGREYSQHAMERMAPDTPQIRAELSRRAEKSAEQLGYKPGTQKYYEFCEKYVEPRNIPPSVIEDAIASAEPVPGKTVGTFVHETADVKVIVNANGKVVTVIPK